MIPEASEVILTQQQNIIYYYNKICSFYFVYYLRLSYTNGSNDWNVVLIHNYQPVPHFQSSQELFLTNLIFASVSVPSLKLTLKTKRVLIWNQR